MVRSKLNVEPKTIKHKQEHISLIHFYKLVANWLENCVCNSIEILKNISLQLQILFFTIFFTSPGLSPSPSLGPSPGYAVCRFEDAITLHQFSIPMQSDTAV